VSTYLDPITVLPTQFAISLQKRSKSILFFEKEKPIVQNGDAKRKKKKMNKIHETFRQDYKNI
jgi:hypothetical protein